jgi:thiol-disulfide isomerase/thioredoxin
MFNRANLLIVAVAIVGAALGLLVGQRFDRPAEIPVPPGVTVLKPGEAPPDLSFADMSGKTRRLSEWNGKVVLLNFWATWCGPCREEMPLLDRARGKGGLEVVGIAVDDDDAVRDYLKESPVGYPILLGGEQDNISILFGDTRGVFPFSVLLGRDGKVLAQRAGSFSESTLAAWLESHPDK